MSLLSVIQNVCGELKLPQPTTFVYGNTDSTIRSLLALANRAGIEARSKYEWPQLSRQHDITLATGTASYALPEDFDSLVFDSYWNSSNIWRILGPLSPQEYQLYQNGGIAAPIFQRFRIKGRTTNQFFVLPTPDSNDNGNTVLFEYQSASWIRPKTWTASTTFLANSYCSYNGNYYQASGGGVSGSTAPTHTSGTASDGGINWIYVSATYERFTADTDVSLLSESCLELDIKWRWAQINRLPYRDLKAEADDAWAFESTALSGGKTLDMAATNTEYLLSQANMPDTGYGGI